MNLPSDLNRSIEKIHIEKLFVNEYKLTTKQLKNNLDDNLKQNENGDRKEDAEYEYKQQLHAPNEDDVIFKTNNTSKRLEKIREVKKIKIS